MYSEDQEKSRKFSQSAFDWQILLHSYLLIWKLNFEFPFWLEVSSPTQLLCPAQKPLQGRVQSPGSGCGNWLLSSEILLWFIPNLEPEVCWDFQKGKEEAGRGFHSNLLILMWVNASHIQSHETICSRIYPLHPYLPLVPTKIWLQEETVPF